MLFVPLAYYEAYGGWWSILPIWSPPGSPMAVCSCTQTQGTGRFQWWAESIFLALPPHPPPPSSHNVPRVLISNVDGLDLWEKKSRHTIVFFSSALWLRSVLGLQPFTALEIQAASFHLDVLLHSFLCLWSELMCLYSLSYVLLSLYVKMAAGCHGRCRSWSQSLDQGQQTSPLSGFICLGFWPHSHW